jgi:hypothetical protein
MKAKGRPTAKAKRVALSAALALASLLLLAPSANAVEPPAELARLGGQPGLGAGQVLPGSSAADPVTGQIYVLDSGNLSSRISEFTPWGQFIKAFGWDVAPGAVNEVQEVRVRAGAGAFKLTFGADTTADLPFDASATQVKSALEALPSIGGASGQVAVTENPGSTLSEAPAIYAIVFKGSLAGIDVGQIAASNGSTPLSGGVPSTSLEVRTRADGVGAAHVGLESCTAESGCQAGVEGPRAGQLNIGVLSTLAVDSAGEVFVSENAAAPRIQQFDSAGRFLRVWGGDVINDGAAGTGVLGPGSATVTSVTTTEKAFRVGQKIEGTGIEAGTTIEALGNGTITLSKPAGPAATGSPSAISSPAGAGNSPVNEKQTITLGSNTTGGSFTLRFETPNPSPTSATTAAIPWNATALELEERLVALSNIDAPDISVSGPAGGPWVVEFKGARYGGSDVKTLQAEAGGLTVSSGQKTATVTSANSGEVCEVAADCQGGAAGAAQGQFNGPVAAFSPTGKLLVADSHEAGLLTDSRVQRFSTGGAFESEVKVPGEQIRSLAVAPGSGNLYVIYGTGGESTKEDIHVLDPASGAQIGVRKVKQPQQLAVDPAGNLWVTATDKTRHEADNVDVQHVDEFDAAGNQLLPNRAEEESCERAEEGLGECELFTEVHFPGLGNPFGANSHQGLGAGPAGDLFVALNHKNQIDEADEAYVAVYGPPPVRFEAPPAVAPSIEAQYAIAVDTTSAELGARINPHLWPDATYYLEYGTAPCSEGGCAKKPLPPGAALTKKVIDAPVPAAPVLLSGLEPGTTYHYRFIAQSSGGGPAGGKEASFTTAKAPGVASSCPNDAFRTGASAALPDCRAYEMVSPVDKEGADVMVLRKGDLAQPLQQASSSGGRLVFASRRSFGDSPTAPWIGQYLAARGADGWSTHSLNAPVSEFLAAGGANRLNPELFAFSPDLCEAWSESMGDPQPSPAAPPGYRDLYRRTDETCGGPGYEPMSTLVPPSWMPHEKEAGWGFQIGFQGASADGTKAFFIANDKLAPEGSAKQTQLYARVAGDPQLHFVCILPDGAPLAGFCSAGKITSGQGGFSNGRVLGFFTGAVSEDGSRVYWSAGGGAAPIYLRENPTEAQSALSHGAATGTGRLTNGSEAITSLVAAKGKANLSAGSAQITLTETSVGEFVAGQPITGSGIPAATTVVSVEGSALNLSAAVEAGKTATGVTVSSTGPMPFEVGQRISAPGISQGTTITAVAPGSLTISAKATLTKAGVALGARGECTEAAKACTIPVSERAEQESGVSGSEFRAAAADGSRALFLNGNGLYEFTLAGQATDKIAGRVLGFMGASKDAGRVYFASKEALAPGAEEGEPNLYLYEAAGGYQLVGVLAQRDVNGGLSALGTEILSHASRVSPDGLHAAFASFGSPTGYDNTDVATGDADAEVYLYDASAKGGEGELVCASCNPTSARPKGREFELYDGEQNAGPVAATIPGLQSSFYGTRALAEDGKRLFFESFDALLPRDTNGKLDVYEWEAPGTGSCSEAAATFSTANEGCIYLISTGKSASDSSFLDATPSGSDAFFTTDESLLGQDKGARDVYDARIGGGLPAPQGPPPACEGEECQPPSSAPNDKTPASASFHGQGSPTRPGSPRCRKGTKKVRAKGKTRCVKPHKAKSKRHRAANRDRGGAR